jgi:hypothetical protein
MLRMNHLRVVAMMLCPRLLWRDEYHNIN